MTFPVLPEWASQDEVDPISGQNNVVEPPPEKKDSGWSYLEKPPRQWWNWLQRQTFVCLEFLFNQASTVTTNNLGVGLFTREASLITIDAYDIADSTKYLRAVGYKALGAAPVFSAGSIQSSGLSLGAGTISGNQPITGGANVIVRGTSSPIV